MMNPNLYNGVNPNMQPGIIVPPFPSSATINQQVLYELADGTGGFVIANSNDLLGGMEKIGKEQNEFYILGYVPVESAEGSCHALKVKVGRGGTSIRHRSGYCNAKQVDILAGKPIETELESRANGTQSGDIAATMEVPFFYTSPNVARVNVAIEIPSSAVKFEKVKGKQHGEVNVLGIAYRPEGGVAAKFSDTVKLDFQDKKQIEEFTQKPLHYENQFEIASGKYNLKVVFNSGGESFGKLEKPLTIEPYDGKQFATSGILLTTHFVRATDMETGLDAELISGHEPLVAGGLSFTATGLYKFKTSDTVAVYMELYDPLLTSETPPRVSVQLKVLDAKSGAQKIDSGEQPMSNFIRKGSALAPIALKLPVNMLSAGSYKVSIAAMDSAGRMVAARTADFTVE